MKSVLAVWAVVLLIVCSQAEELYRLPEELLIGAGVSALQTEGAWNVSDKAESAADHLLHSDVLNKLGFGGAGFEEAADSYHRYEDDVKAAAALKLQLYRFSISWSRLLPTADSKSPNPDGVRFYNKLIDLITAHNMTPMATLHHFDHPFLLEEQFHGWQDRQMVYKFKDYARFAFHTFSDRVKYWTTVNEPNMYCVYFPQLFMLVGMLNQTEARREYHCVHNTVLAHMEAYHVFREEIFPLYGGQVGFTAKLMPAAPESASQQDAFLAEAFNQLHAGNVLHPVVFGDYPPLYKSLVHTETLPEFNDTERALLRGSADFLGLNVYFGFKASYRESAAAERPLVPGVGKVVEELPHLQLSLDVHGGDTSLLAGYTAIEPQVMERALLWAWRNYGKPIVITENGYGDVAGLGVHDQQRAAYHSAQLRALVSTARQWGIQVKGYCAWSLIDAYEFSGAFKRPFGLVHVDYEFGTRNRSLKDSSSFFLELAEKRVVPLVLPSGASVRTACWLLLLAALTLAF